jgi:hypothetical protein
MKDHLTLPGSCKIVVGFVKVFLRENIARLLSDSLGDVLVSCDARSVPCVAGN